MKALMSEILNYHSNQDKEIDIYVKEKTRIYMEDETNFIINITKVTITSYSESDDIPAMSILVPTKTPQSGQSKKSAFSILKNVDLDLDRIFSISNVTDYEINLAMNEAATIKLVRSSLEMSNFEVHREYENPYSIDLFILPIYLQDKSVKITDSSFNLTNGILYSIDPLNIYFENLFLDLYTMRYAIIDTIV